MRSVPEWIGKTDDSRIPNHVRVRIFDRHGGRCHCCNRLILAGEVWDVDHVIALINGGRHCESNMAPILREHHKAKTRADVADKSRTYRVRKRHLGLKKAKRPIPGSRASGWKRKLDGTWVRR